MTRNPKKRSRQDDQIPPKSKDPRCDNTYTSTSLRYFLRSIEEGSPLYQEYLRFAGGVTDGDVRKKTRRRFTASARFKRRDTKEGGGTPHKVLLRRDGNEGTTASATPVRSSPNHPGHVRTTRKGRLWRKEELIAKIEYPAGATDVYSLTAVQEIGAAPAIGADNRRGPGLISSPSASSLPRTLQRRNGADITARTLRFIEQNVPTTEEQDTTALLLKSDFEARAKHTIRSSSQRTLHGNVSASETLNAEIEHLLEKYDEPLKEIIGTDAISIFKYSPDTSDGRSAEYAHTHGRCVYPTSPSRLFGGRPNPKVETIAGLGTILDPQFKENCSPASRHHNTKQLLGERLVQFSNQLKKTLNPGIGSIICRTGSARIGDSQIRKAFVELENPDIGIKIHIPCNQPLTQKQPREEWFETIKDFYMQLVNLATEQPTPHDKAEAEPVSARPGRR